jgi:hypothetical protein
MTNADSNINDDLKEAILSCAREEMRKFIGAMLMPGITNQTNDTSPSYRSRPPTNNEGRQTPAHLQDLAGERPQVRHYFLLDLSGERPQVRHYYQQPRRINHDDQKIIVKSTHPIQHFVELR